MNKLLRFVKKGNLYVVSTIGYLLGIVVLTAWTLVTYLIPVPDRLKAVLFGLGVVAMLFLFGLNGIATIIRREIPFVVPETVTGLPAVLLGYIVLAGSWFLMAQILIGILR